jgi:hypothetical protein
MRPAPGGVRKGAAGGGTAHGPAAGAPTVVLTTAAARYGPPADVRAQGTGAVSAQVTTREGDRAGTGRRDHEAEPNRPHSATKLSAIRTVPVRSPTRLFYLQP